ncbi:pentapeptide repeat-containing protein [Rhodococcus cerastii]|nr:pentapeptide repeat-containing protein [Rhodococcus cerastii]
MHHALRSPRPTRAAAGATTVLAALAAVLVGAGPAHAAPCTLDMLAPDADCSHTVLPAHSVLDDRDLSHINLDHAVMPHLEASRAQFDAAEFDHTDLQGLFGVDTNLRGARFENTQLDPVVLNPEDHIPTQLGGVDFTKAQFRRVNAHEILAPSGNFSAVTITDSDFGDADLAGATFAEARIQGNTTFADTDLDGVVFDRAVIDGVDLPDTDLEGASFAKARIQGNTTFARAKAKGASFAGAVFNSVDLTAAKLVGADFTGATLTAVNLTRADLSGARWIDGRRCAAFSIGRCN